MLYYHIQESVRRENMSKFKFHKRILIVTLIVTVVIPQINALLIRTLGLIGKKELWNSELVNLINGVYDFINAISLFAVAACITYAMIVRKHRVLIPVIVVVAVTLVHASGIFMGHLINETAIIDSKGTLAIDMGRMVSVWVQYGVIILTAVIVSKCVGRRKTKDEIELLSVHGPLSLGAVVTTLTASATLFGMRIIETVNYIISKAAYDTLDFVFPYITALIYCVLGYFVVYTVTRIIEKKPKSTH